MLMHFVTQEVMKVKNILVPHRIAWIWGSSAFCGTTVYFILKTFLSKYNTEFQTNLQSCLRPVDDLGEW